MRPSGRRWLVRTSEATTGAVACSGRTSGSDTSENVPIVCRWPRSKISKSAAVRPGTTPPCSSVTTTSTTTWSTEARSTTPGAGCCAPTRASRTNPAAAMTAVRFILGLTGSAPP